MGTTPKLYFLRKLQKDNAITQILIYFNIKKYFDYMATGLYDEDIVLYNGKALTFIAVGLDCIALKKQLKKPKWGNVERDKVYSLNFDFYTPHFYYFAGPVETINKFTNLNLAPLEIGLIGISDVDAINHECAHTVVVRRAAKALHGESLPPNLETDMARRNVDAMIKMRVADVKIRKELKLLKDEVENHENS